MMGNYIFRMCLWTICATTSIVFISAAEPANAPWSFEILARHRPGTYFWAPGSVWDEANFEYNLRQYREAGFGTLHIVPMHDVWMWSEVNLQIGPVRLVSQRSFPGDSPPSK